MNQHRCKNHKIIIHAVVNEYLIFQDDWSTILKCKKCKKISDKWQTRATKKRKINEKRQKEELWDCYIEKEFYKGFSKPYYYCPKLPKDIIRFIRATILLKNLILELKRKKRSGKDKKHDAIKGKSITSN